MQNKSTYLRRLLVIYIAFFAVLLVGLTLDVAPGFRQGLEAGTSMGQDLSEQLEQATPQSSYLLFNCPLETPAATQVATTDSLRTITARPSTITFHVTEPAGDHSMWWHAFAAVGGSPWVYWMTVAASLSFLFIIILMWLIIRSVRRSIRLEMPLERCNVWYLRLIALLSILSELCNSLSSWIMNNRAAELIADTAYTVNTTFHFSYSTLIMGLLILFAAELTAIGRDLGEEQKLTI
ncbi:MAG: DUF2975 domain-containing protein [Alistipes sp.]|nr:DUF2975 domain-containing protein [Alistipes sp.]